MSISLLFLQSERNGSRNEYRQSVHGYGFRRNGPQGDGDVDIAFPDTLGYLGYYLHIYFVSAITSILIFISIYIDIYISTPFSTRVSVSIFYFCFT
jgi:hypothetical protein